MLSSKNLTNQQKALFKLLNYSGIPINSDLVNEELQKHPDFPSLLAICDVLTALNIPNRAFSATFEELQNLQCPFLAHTDGGDDGLVIVTQVAKDHIYFATDKSEKRRLSREAFKATFSGVVLMVEPSENYNSGISLKSRVTAIKMPAILTALILAFISTLVFHTGYFTNLAWQTILLTIFKSAGLVTSVLLLVQSIDSNNSLVQAICQSGGKTDCNAILSSKAANVFEGLTWSEVGFFYFGGTWLLLIFGGGSNFVWLVLALLNFISLPYTVYSIYYQARVAQKWCILCCTVQALLWLEFIPLINNFGKSLHAPDALKMGEDFSMLFTCIATPVILWVLMKPMFIKMQQFAPLKEQLRAFKYNSDLFNKMLTDQPKYALPDTDCCIMMGDERAENIFTLVSNPNCPPCAKTHQVMEELLNHNGNIQARIIFTTDRNHPVSSRLMALNALPDKKIVIRAMHDWYEKKQKNVEEWQAAYPVELDQNDISKLDRQKDWCTFAEITFTPTLLLNGYRLPHLYALSDLKYMLYS